MLSEYSRENTLGEPPLPERLEFLELKTGLYLVAELVDKDKTTYRVLTQGLHPLGTVRIRDMTVTPDIGGADLLLLDSGFQINQILLWDEYIETEQKQLQTSTPNASNVW